MKYCIAGKNEIALYCINLLLELNIKKEDIIVVCNSTDFGKHNWQPSLKKYSKDNGIKEMLLEDIYDIEPMIFLSLEFDKIIRTKFFKSNKLFNIHFSLLPAYKGMYTSIFPILNGENTSGVTLHKIDDGIDTGEIIKQKIFNIPFGITGYRLYQQYLYHSKKLLKESLKAILEDKIEFKEQEVNGASYYSKKAIDFKNVKINFFKTCFEICNFINAFSFRPYQTVKYNLFNIVKAVPTKNKSIQKPGNVVNNEFFSIQVSTIDYNVVLLKDALDEILFAAKTNDLAKISEFNSLGYDLEDKNDKGWNALIVSCFNGSQDVVKYLIDKGCNVNCANNNGTSPLMYSMTNASLNGNLSILKLLSDNGADIYHKDLKGLDILHYARKLQNTKVIKYLEKKF